jgi:glutaredoxin
MQREGESLEEMIESNLAHGKVTLWTRGDGCNATGKTSMKAKKLLMKNNIEFQENVVGTDQNVISYSLLMHTGYSSYPNIYFGEEHVGGIDDLKAYLSDTSVANRIIGENGIVLSVTTTDDEEASESYQRCFEKLS